MLTGKQLGAAIAVAIDRKISSGAIKSKAEIARHFGIKPPSIYDWINKGSISKDKLEKLWAYFDDVVGPEHWGLIVVDEAHRTAPEAGHHVMEPRPTSLLGFTASPTKQHSWPFKGISAARFEALLRKIGPADSAVAMRDFEYQLEIIMSKWERIAKEKKEKSA